MGVIDLWVGRDGKPTKRHGIGSRYRVTHPGHPSSSWRTKTEAGNHWRKISSQETTPAGSVGAMVDIWKAGKAHHKRKTVLAAKADAARVKARWGSTPVTKVLADEVRTWIASMESQRGKGDNLKVFPAANATRAKALQCLSGAMAIAIDRGMIEKNPCDGINPGKQRKVEPHYLEADELVELAVSAGRDRLLVMTLGTTAIRIGEAAALEVRDVDVRRRRLRIRDSKNGEARDVPVTATLLAELPLVDEDGNPRPKRDPLFTAPRGGRMSVDNWRTRVWDEIKPYEEFRIHDLRHTAVSLAIASGADIKMVQRMCGHKTATLTLDLYGHLWDRGLDDVADRMDAMINKKPAAGDEGSPVTPEG